MTVTPTTIPLLFSLLNEPSLPIRLATAGSLLKMVNKGLKEPSDKLQLIKVLALGQVLDALEQRTRTEQISRGSDTDEGEESYREALGRLLNGLGLELAKLTEEVGRPTRLLYFHSIDTISSLFLMNQFVEKRVRCSLNYIPLSSGSCQISTTIRVQPCSLYSRSC